MINRMDTLDSVRDRFNRSCTYHWIIPFRMFGLYEGQVRESRMGDHRSPKHEFMHVEDHEAFFVSPCGASSRIGPGSRNPAPPLPLFAPSEQEGTPSSLLDRGISEKNPAGTAPA